MSPSLWWDHRSILNAIERQATKPDLRIWLDMGTAEGLKHLRDADMLERLLIKRGWRLGVDLAYLEAQGAVHTRKHGRTVSATSCVSSFPPECVVSSRKPCEKPRFPRYLGVGLTMSVLCARWRTDGAICNSIQKVS